MISSIDLSSTCSQSSSFLCVSSLATRQGFSSFILSQIDDGHIDCAEAIDERNTLPHCSQSSMLGSDFLCLSTNTSIPSHRHCFNDHRCLNRADHNYWYDRQHRPNDCFAPDDFTCSNGQCVIQSIFSRSTLEFGCEINFLFILIRLELNFIKHAVKSDQH